MFVSIIVDEFVTIAAQNSVMLDLVSEQIQAFRCAPSFVVPKLSFKTQISFQAVHNF